MNQRGHKRFILFTAIMVLGLCYAMAELTFRLVLMERLYPHQYFLSLSAQAASRGLSAGEYVESLDNDPFLGWNDPIIEHDAAGATQTILFLGDSVTFGYGVERGKDDFPSLIHEKLNHTRPVRVINMAVRGFGVDQMMLKLLLEGGRFRPDLVVLAYIPHDLIRPGQNYGFGLSKPQFREHNGFWQLATASNQRRFNEAYQNALGQFRILPWYGGFLFDNLPYYLPDHHGDHFEGLYRLIRQRLERFAESHDARILFVRLANTMTFTGMKTLEKRAAKVFGEPGGRIRYYDSERCVREKAAAEGLNVHKTFYFHPDAAGHRLFAQCLGQQLESRVSAP